MWAKGNGFKRSSATEAFTLIELLTVISIIGVLAAILTGLSGIAASKMRTHRINGELQQLVTAIEGYKGEVGFYPPDNQLQPPGATLDLARAQMNPLYFELTGALYDKAQFTALNQKDPVAPTELKRAFGVDGISNSARDRHDVKYQGIHFKEAQYAPIVGYNNIYLLTVPVTGTNMLSVKPPPDGKGGQANVWLYDSSSTNRHNLATFDLWAVYNIGKRVVTNGNWR